MITNLHTHTPRCHHARGTEREYVEAAIAAGAALIAVGSMVSSGLQRLISGAGNGGGSAMSYGSSSSGGAAALNYESTLTVEVTGKISGNDIVLSGKKTNDKNSR